MHMHTALCVRVQSETAARALSAYDTPLLHHRDMVQPVIPHTVVLRPSPLTHTFLMHVLLRQPCTDRSACRTGELHSADNVGGGGGCAGAGLWVWAAAVPHDVLPQAGRGRHCALAAVPPGRRFHTHARVRRLKSRRHAGNCLAVYL